MSPLQARRRMKNLLMFIPNMIFLCVRLMTDSRVPTTEKALVAGAVIYAIVPLDLIPDMLPFVGQIDDAYLIAATLLRLVDRTDARVVREHWKGGGDVVELIEAMAQMTAKIVAQADSTGAVIARRNGPGKGPRCERSAASLAGGRTGS